MYKQLLNTDTIVALATPHGAGAIAVIRLSGQEAFRITEKFFTNRQQVKKSIQDLPSHTVHFGLICDDEVIVDEVLISIFKSPHSYTGEDTIEISCHGSPYIQQRLLQLFIKNGARMAQPGEYTMRAFLNGKLDLTQAEAVADLIASNSAVSHQVAMQQMRGGFSTKIKVLRDNLIDFAALIELELDFSEEDVEFADRSQLKNLVLSIQRILERLIESFEIGNVIKNGIPVAIVGKPNAGKSTLLNALLEEERAIVSEIPGTTRDTIEDELIIDGVMFRFIDTAGIRETVDVIESIGVSKTFEAIKYSAIIIYLFDAHELSRTDLQIELDKLHEHIGQSQLLVLANKIDKEDLNYLKTEYQDISNMLYVSAREKQGLEALKHKLIALFDSRTVNITETVVTNARHADALRKANSALYKVMEGLNHQIPGDLLAIDIREALDAMGTITGEINSEHLLDSIFTRFCIGK